MFLRLILIPAVLFLGGWLVAATPFSPWLFRAYQTEAGLPDLGITGVEQTADGYLWVATRGGPVCFNGEKFAPLPLPQVNALPSREVRALFRDRQDQLWMAMERGPVFCFKADGLEQFTAKDGLSSERVLRLIKDGAGAVWVVYPDEMRRIVAGRVSPEIVRLGSRGDATSFEPFQAPERKAFNGLALVIVRAKAGASGKITLTAEAEGLKAGECVVRGVKP